MRLRPEGGTMTARKDTINQLRIDQTQLANAQALGRLVSHARRSKQWSVRELGKQSGVHHSHLSLLEKGEVRRPAPEILRKLATVLDLEAEDLYSYAGYTITDNLPGLEPYLRARYNMGP